MFKKSLFINFKNLIRVAYFHH